METTWTAPNGDVVTDPTSVLTEEQLEFLYGEYGLNANLMINNAYDVALVNADSLGVDADDFAQTKIFQLYNDSMVGVDPKQTWSQIEWYIFNNTDFTGETEIGGTGVTVQNQYEHYFDLEDNKPEEFRELHETLFANGFYGQGASEESMNNKTASTNAFHNAINELVARGKVPIAQDFDQEAMQVSYSFKHLGVEPFEGVTKDTPVWTDDFIHNMGDQAGQRVFGRDLSDQERELTLSLVRGLESDDTYQGPSAADIDAALEESNPVEAKTMDMSGVLQNFASLVRGR
jgi:hypothetical protein